MIATSGLFGLTGTFYIPTSQYSGGSFSSDYVRFDGTFGALTGNGYEITGIHGAEGNSAVDAEREEISSPPPFLFNTEDVYVGPDAMANIAKGLYDAYSYGNGQYYSNGQSYYDIYFQ